MRTQTLVRPRRLRPAGLLSAALSLAVILSSGTALADSRDDLKAAYNKALGQYNNLELDQALAALNEGLAGTTADDPATAPLRMLRAVIIFSNSGNKNETTAAFVDAVKADYNVTIPTELRSPDLQKLLDKARKDSGASAPSEYVRHTSPSVDGCGQDLKFEVLTSGIPDGGQAGLYWRNVGDSGEFKSVTMDAFGNIATAQVLASEHGDKPVEYFVYVYDGANKALGNKGAQDNPLVADVKCVKEVPKEKEPEKPPPPKHSLPKIFINIGLGTGVGVARGVADQSYSQYTPAGNFNYGLKEFACALARWSSGTGDLPGDPVQYQTQMGPTVMAYGTPYSVEQLAGAYNAGECAAHHKVSTGMASAPFHIAPEIGGRLGKSKLVLSGFLRIQAVTGSKVYRDDPKASLPDSYMNDVTNPNPEGIRSKPGVTIAGGLKIKYFLGSDEKKFRLFVGGFLGGGFTRLRVPMGFANDRNGNSVPDDKETAFENGGQCTAVWPYKYDCGDPGSMASVGAGQQAAQVSANADKTQRIDTVRIGGGMLGGVFGFHWQAAKHFGLFGELQVGVWFPRTTSLLIDLNIGPVITF
ncbi:hypothetical protein OV079_42490 [Nannocystis pusilla]|uniref:Uncharacterized protein n=1 Tax=Nannocystis pusilla TaxID=889268 RepID=A0A9X3EXB1_9BACT|nr:hypothetical protein [Nannocystis pusilla]MCY1012109.1 hypothetical protein [Nannocystis pusilla]